MENIVLFRWAISLEIFGFLLASIVGLILLNRDVIGSYAEKLDKKLTYPVSRFQKRFDNRANPLYTLAHVVSEDVKVPPSLVFQLLTPFILLVIVVGGLLFNVSWIFWAGLILSVLRLIPLVIKMTKSRISGSFFPVLISTLFIVIFFDYILEPFIVISIFYIRLAKFTAKLLSTGDTIKRILIIFGSIMIAIGLILEAISMWQ